MKYFIGALMFVVRKAIEFNCYSDLVEVMSIMVDAEEHGYEPVTTVGYACPVCNFDGIVLVGWSKERGNHYVGACPECGKRQFLNDIAVEALASKVEATKQPSVAKPKDVTIH